MIQVASQQAVQALGLEHKLSLCSDPSAPLIVLVHGRAGTYDVMWTFRRCLPEQATIVAPQAHLFDEFGGYSWWNVESPGSPMEKAAEAVGRLDQFILKFSDYYKLQPRKILALGFSQGAGLLSVLLQQSRQRFCGVGLLAGFVLPTELGGQGELPPVFIAHGLADDILPISKARQGAQHLQGLGFPVSMVEDDVGHKVGTAGMRALKEWVQKLLS
ncbi:MAG: hypothetical protein K1X79_09755 [Oligoflexia bacterium]|nr:hypothetical protein [Oligoflexia bacterium]